MDKQNPFSLYDFLGYFVPGAIAVFCFAIIYNWDTNSLQNSVQNTLSGLGKTELLLPFTLFSYVFGHILSYLSSVTIERYGLITVGYPPQFLLVDEKSPENDEKQNEVINNSQVSNELGNASNKERFKKYFRVKRFVDKIEVLKYLLISIILLPIFIGDLLTELILGRVRAYAKPLSVFLSKVIIKKLNNIAVKYGSNTDSWKSEDIFRLAYHYTLENSPSHQPKMQNYVALYGFTRILTLTLIGFFWSFVLLTTINWKRLVSTHELWFLFIIGFFTFISYGNYMKFHRRFSQEVLMALSVIYPPDKNSGKAKRVNSEE